MYVENVNAPSGSVKDLLLYENHICYSKKYIHFMDNPVERYNCRTRLTAYCTAPGLKNQQGLCFVNESCEKLYPKEKSVKII